MNNLPKIKVGIVAVSRDCFPESLSVNRRKALVEAYQAKYDAADIYECPICIVESEIHMVQALEDIKKAGCNALAVYQMCIRDRLKDGTHCRHKGEYGQRHDRGWIPHERGRLSECGLAQICTKKNTVKNVLFPQGIFLFC